MEATTTTTITRDLLNKTGVGRPSKEEATGVDLLNNKVEEIGEGPHIRGVMVVPNREVTVVAQIKGTTSVVDRLKEVTR